MAAADRKSRLSRSAEFDRVYRSGRSAQHRLLVLYRFDRPEDVPAGNSRGAVEPAAPDESGENGVAPVPAGPESRIGITVSKKLGGAVERNRLKRQLREALQACVLLDGDADYVAIARPGLAEKIESDGFESLQELVADLAGKLQPATSKR